jgi:hypothetical protein
MGEHTNERDEKCMQLIHLISSPFEYEYNVCVEFLIPEHTCYIAKARI